MTSYIDEQSLQNVNKFLKFIKKRELYALGQQISKLNSKIKKLHKTGRPITISTIDNHKDIYDLCCSCIEKYLKILYGIKKASQGVIIDFEKVKKTSIYEVKKKLVSSDRNYLLSPNHALPGCLFTPVP